MANNEKCVCCGEVIPEGRQVCPNCEAKKAELKPCKKCGGTAQFDWFYDETAFGDKRFVCFRCTKCHKRTTAYMCLEGNGMEEKYRKDLAELWNRGCY